MSKVIGASFIVVGIVVVMAGYRQVKS